MPHQGFVIKKTDIGEYDQLVTLYTREFGKMAAVAKSVKKNSSKQAGHLGIFNLVDFNLVHGKNYPIITSAQSSQSFRGIKSSLPKNLIGFFVLEIVSNIVYDHDKDTKLWNFLSEKLEELEAIEPLNGNLKKYFQALKSGFADILGYGKDLNEQDAVNFLVSLSPKNICSLQFADLIL